MSVKDLVHIACKQYSVNLSEVEKMQAPVQKDVRSGPGILSSGDFMKYPRKAFHRHQIVATPIAVSANGESCGKNTMTS